MSSISLISLALYIIQMVAVVLVGFVLWIYARGMLLNGGTGKKIERLWYYDHLWMLAIAILFLVRAMIAFIIDLSGAHVSGMLYAPLTVAIMWCMWSMSVWRTSDVIRKLLVAFVVVDLIYLFHMFVSAYGQPLVATHGATLLPFIITIDSVLVYYFIVLAARHYETDSWAAYASKNSPWQPKRVAYGMVLFLVFSVINSMFALSYATPAEARIIGFAQPDERVPRWSKEAEYIKAYTRGKGVHAVLRNAASDSTRQVAQVQEMLDLGVGALIIIPVDSKALHEVAITAYQMGVPIISYDRLMIDMPVDYYITIDMRDVGRLAAEELAKRHDSARIVYVGGSDTDNNAHLHKRGFEDALAGYQDKDFQIVTSWFTERWQNTVAATEMQEVIDAGVEFDVIVAGNDGLAGAASDVAREAGIDVVYISGGDGDEEACQRIIRGEQTLTIYKSIKRLSEEGTQFALDLAAGRPVVTEKVTFNGSFDVPTKTIEPIVITKEVIDRGDFNENCEPQIEL